MSDASLFLRKRKDKERRSRVPSRSVGGGGPSTSTASQNAPSPSSSSAPRPNATASSSSTVKPEPVDSNGKNPNITEIKIYSSGSDGGMRFNFMRLNHEKEIDPTQIGSKLLLNRKRPGPKQPPQFAINDEGKIVGKYVYDASGKPVLDSEGKPVIEKKAEGETMDMSLVVSAPPGEDPVGRAPGKKKMKKGTKEVFHQDIEVMRLRREEAQPWLLESSRPRANGNNNIPEMWVGRMQEPSALPTVLLVNDGTTDGFEMVPLGRTYRFDPERPFKPLDSDEANKLFDHQTRHKIHDRWALRPEGSNDDAPTPGTPVVRVNIKAERDLEERAMRMEGRLRLNNGSLQDRKPKVERYEDDYVKEGRRAERGLEGGIDEELDFDETEHFQDDDDVNTFYRNAEEEDDARDAEEQQKKEYRLANANVGDRPQIAEDDDEEDLFGEKKKYSDEGKQLKKILKKRAEDGEDDNMFSDDESDDTDTESIDSKTSQNKDQDKDKDKDSKPSADGDRPSRPPSRGPGSRGTSSPTGKRPNGPMPGKASTAPPGSGAALLAQRAASRGASPRPSGGARAGSPLSGRAASPEGRATSPVMRGNSPSRGQSPAPGPARGSSPVSGPSTRDASPAPASGGSQKKSTGNGKRKTTSESPGPSTAGASTNSPSSKRKNSPSETANRAGKKSKKSGSNTPTPGPEEIESFPGMITKQDVLDWFRSLKKETVPMSEAIAAFRNRIMNAGKNKEANQKLFLGWMKMLADQEEKMLRLKDEYR
ncbi:hypothetical protein I302_102375 [Kwoniella bestiolae CBS 10118]|uniref:Uncharacterized protein n=1 Tax=Kwoniella bestiolae CBS 10118 TaxID=1296100 RepID=A0A1B9GF09_9TREE|nr:hypothetical protein I302_01066 [Kwoniella bestiolae CBS 10118]OCF29558.1 hypothetical protein I302_01066 [Kwoniella bestiolae CBS 10118]